MVGKWYVDVYPEQRKMDNIYVPTISWRKTQSQADMVNQSVNTCLALSTVV